MHVCCYLLLSAMLATKDAPLDTTYLRDYAETRGFMLGRPVAPNRRPTARPCSSSAQPRVARLRLYEFDVPPARRANC